MLENLTEEAAAALSHAHFPMVFTVEREFDQRGSAAFMRDYWLAATTTCTLAYLAVIFGIQWLMRDRPPFKLQRTLELWNWGLALFSIAGICKILPYVYFILRHDGFFRSLCQSYHDEEWMRPSVFWMYLFAYSKVVELGDTLLIVLRKRPLIFLHWYHHVTVLIYTWYSFSDTSPSGLWFIAMNYSVHGFMYTYYGLRAMSVKVPKPVAMSLTGLQILQMVLGCCINLSVYAQRLRGEECLVSRENTIASSLMYCSYWLLFTWFFYNAYLRSGGQRAAAAALALERKRKAAALQLPQSDSNGNVVSADFTVTKSDVYTNGKVHYRGKKEGSDFFNGIHKNGEVSRILKPVLKQLNLVEPSKMD